MEKCRILSVCKWEVFGVKGLYFLFSIWTIILFYSRTKDSLNEKFLKLGVLFCLIICSTFNFELLSYQMNVAFLIMIFLISYHVSKLKFSEQFIHFFKGLIIGMAYCSMSILAIYDPASYFINDFISISFMTTVLTVFLSKHYIERLRLLIIGLIQGEVFNFFTYQSIKVQYIIGDLLWLDSLFFTILLITTIRLLSLYFSKKNLKSGKLVKN